MDKKTLELILDKLEDGTFCNCMTDGSANQVRLFKELAHYKSCIGNVKVAEILYDNGIRRITKNE